MRNCPEADGPPMPDLIDASLTHEQFEALGPEIAGILAEATEADFAEWGGRLAAAAEAEDSEGMSRARHSLRGLCGNYGAAALEAAALGALNTVAERAAMLACRDATVAAIIAAAKVVIKAG